MLTYEIHSLLCEDFHYIDSPSINVMNLYLLSIQKTPFIIVTMLTHYKCKENFPPVPNIYRGWTITPDWKAKNIGFQCRDQHLPQLQISTTSKFIRPSLVTSNLLKLIMLDSIDYMIPHGWRCPRLPHLNRMGERARNTAYTYTSHSSNIKTPPILYNPQVDSSEFIYQSD